MPSFRISTRTRGELVEIYHQTESAFRAYQAGAYYAGLIRTFGLLADFPGMGQRADHLRKDLRRLRFQSHFVFYAAQSEGVEILAVIHTTRNIRPELFE